MTIREFRLLKPSEKDEIIWTNGILLKNFGIETNVCDIYKLFDFYVACCYRLDRIKVIIIAANFYPERLPYLKESHQIVYSAPCYDCSHLKQYLFPTIRIPLKNQPASTKTFPIDNYGDS